MSEVLYTVFFVSFLRSLFHWELWLISFSIFKGSMTPISKYDVRRGRGHYLRLVTHSCLVVGNESITKCVLSLLKKLCLDSVFNGVSHHDNQPITFSVMSPKILIRISSEQNISINLLRDACGSFQYVLWCTHLFIVKY